MKKFVFGFLTCFILMTGLVYAADPSFKAVSAPFKIFLDGKLWTPNEAPAVVINNKTYLPLRALGEALGTKINWNDSKKQVEIGDPPSEEVTMNADGMEITVIRKIQELKGRNAFEFQFKNISDKDVTYDISHLGSNLGGTYNIEYEGYNMIKSGVLKPGESYKGIASFGNDLATNVPIFYYKSGKVQFRW
jgi:hypothetical protein